MIDIITNVTSGVSELYAILAKCRAILSNFPKSRLSFVRKQAKHVVHTLAKASRFSACSQSFDLFPFVFNHCYGMK